MNRRGIQLAISTLIILILGIVLLIALIFVFVRGVDKFQKVTEPIFNTVEGSAIKEACGLACSVENKLTYCCEEYELQNFVVMCNDPKLDLDCSLDCGAFECFRGN
ncbi:MAG: hypothetical protein IH948_08435 [Bacteroidetes bacterium]|nr:hypothetical protein [Bacteroidota bacterium]